MPIQLSQHPWRVSSRAMRFVITAALQGISNLESSDQQIANYIVPYDYFQSMTIKLLMGGGFTGTISFLDRYGDLFTGAVIAPTAHNYFGIQWDWAHSAAYPSLTINNQTETHYTPIFNGATLKPTVTLGRTGVSVTFDLVQTAIVNAFLNKSTGPRTFISGLRQSQIVYAIATSPGIQWNYIIEPTAGTTGKELAMGSESYLDFINQKLLPDARNANGEPYVFYFDSQDVLHFHSASLGLGPQGTTNNVVTNVSLQNATPYLNWKFLYGFDYTGDVLEFTPTDDTLLMGQDGATDMTIIATNSNDGTATEYKSQADTPPQGLSGLPNVGLASRWHPDEQAVTNPRFNNNVEDQNYHLVKARDSAEILGRIVQSHMHAREAHQGRSSGDGESFSEPRRLCVGTRAGFSAFRCLHDGCLLGDGDNTLGR